MIRRQSNLQRNSVNISTKICMNVVNKCQHTRELFEGQHVWRTRTSKVIARKSKKTQTVYMTVDLLRFDNAIVILFSSFHSILINGHNRHVNLFLEPPSVPMAMLNVSFSPVA